MITSWLEYASLGVSVVSLLLAILAWLVKPEEARPFIKKLSIPLIVLAVGGIGWFIWRQGYIPDIIQWMKMPANLPRWALTVIAVGLVAMFGLISRSLYRDQLDAQRHMELDRQLFYRIREEVLLSTGSIAFVRDHDYAAPYAASSHNDLEQFLEFCKRPECRFLDDDLESLRVDLVKYIEEFNVTRSRYVTIDTRRPFASREEAWYSVPKEFGHGRYTKDNTNFVQEANEINDCSYRVWETYDKLIQLGRRKLGV
jgi:hypothetical protein